MKVLFVASECAPLAKVGGLADVVGSLPKALKALGIDVRIALPKYDVIDDNKFPSREVAQFTVPFNQKEETITARETTLPGSEMPVYLLGHPHYFGNGGVYIEADASSGGSNAELDRFGLFSRAIPEFIKAIPWQPDIIHCHDWQTGAVPIITETIGPKGTATICTIHNLAYQGIHPLAEVVHAFGEGIARSLIPHPHHAESINFLASAITDADRITTVSPSYAQEITARMYGNGLDELLNKLLHPPIGILNGIDTDYWNPGTDRFLAAHFNNADEREDAKETLKSSLQDELKFLQNPRTPLLVMVSRLTEQKGFDILIPALRALLPTYNFQCAILAAGDKSFAGELSKLAAHYPQKLSFTERFDEALAHRLYAAGDFFLMPSRFEPCGLGQMIAMRYGAIPIATSVGGLKDTVTDGETGFIVASYGTDALMDALEHALYCFHEDPVRFRTIQEKGCKQDFSWRHSAQEYAKLYNDIQLGRN